MCSPDKKKYLDDWYVEIHDSLESTNTYIKNMPLMKKTAVIARVQTGGRGRRGRKWVSERGNLYLSMCFEFDESVEKAPFMGICAAVGVAEALADLGIKTGIKWPNDIVVDSRKICGILPEIFKKDSKIYIIIGIGINVNQRCFSNEIAIPATSAALEIKRDIDLNILADAVIRAVWKNCLDRPNVTEKYKRMCVSLDRQVLVKATEEYTATAIDITGAGELVVLRNGNKIILNSGEVSVRGIYGYAE